MAVGEPLQAVASLVDGAALADAGHHVLEDATLRVVVEHVARDHRRHPGCLRGVEQQTQAHVVAGPEA